MDNATAQFYQERPTAAPRLVRLCSLGVSRDMSAGDKRHDRAILT